MADNPSTPAELCDRPFLYSAAIERGLLSAGKLRRRPWRSLARGVVAHQRLLDTDPFSTLLAAVPLIHPDAVISGRAAALLHGAELDDEAVFMLRFPVEATVPRNAHPPVQPAVRSLRFLQAYLAPDDISTRKGHRVTSPLRTAFDLARRTRPVGDLSENVAALNAMLHVGHERRNRGRPLFTPDELHAYIQKERFHGWRGRRRAADAAEFGHPLIESPAESRMFMELVAAGLPPPVPQFPVHLGGEERAFLDFAYAVGDGTAVLGIEYDGELHAQRREADMRRWALLRDQGVELHTITKAYRGEQMRRAIRRAKLLLSQHGINCPVVPTGHPPRCRQELVAAELRRLRSPR